MERDEALSRIRKCLALSGSPNENEARTALLMARRLMAKYMVEEGEVPEGSGEPEEMDSSVTCTTVRDPWALCLGDMIAGRHRCRSFVRKGYRKKTMTVCFIGFRSDLEVCVRAFEYAVSAVRLGIAEKRMGRADADSYSKGFLKGLEEAYAEQDASEAEETGTDIVALTSVPDEVDDYAERSLGIRRMSVRSYCTDPDAYGSGYTAGRGHLNGRVGGCPIKRIGH